MSTWIKVYRVKVDAQGYASDGRYFGRGAPLYRIEIDNGYTLRYEYERDYDYHAIRARYKSIGHVAR